MAMLPVFDNLHCPKFPPVGSWDDVAEKPLESVLDIELFIAYSWSVDKRYNPFDEREFCRRHVQEALGWMLVKNLAPSTMPHESILALIEECNSGHGSCDNYLALGQVVTAAYARHWTLAMKSRRER